MDEMERKKVEEKHGPIKRILHTTTPPAMEQAAKFFYIRALAAMNTQEVQVTDTSETRGTVVKPIDNTGARLAMKTICPSVGFDDERFEQILINQIRRTPPYNLKGSL